MSKASTRKPKDDIWLRRVPEGFVFASEYDREACAKWGVGSVVRADIVKPRSGRHNRWYHALLRVVYSHQDTYKTLEALKFALKIRLGLVQAVKVSATETHLMPISTSYDAMEDGEFREIVNRTFEIITTEIIPGMDRRARAEMEREVDRLVGS